MQTAIIFDMDGVLVNTEPVINRAAIMGLREFGIEAKPEDFVPFIGAGEIMYIGGVAEKYGLAYRPEMKDRVYEIYLQIVEDMLTVYPGAVDCLTNLTRDGLPMALASSADRIKVDANLKAARIDPGLFKVILSAEDVVHRKPAPDLFLTAAARLGVPPQKCIVVEDALNGIEAAKKAGMRCVAVSTTFNKERLIKAGADCVCDSMNELYESCSLLCKK
jgi:HAD superfamily hydrolase (TIGR01509 family)